MEVKSTILKTHNIFMNHTPIARYHSKSYPLLFCGLASGILCLCLKQYLISTIFLVGSIYSLLFVKNVVLMEFFPDCALFLYDAQNH